MGGTFKGRGAIRFNRIYAVVRAVPVGRVATYGQVAELAGFPRGARLAARALKMSTLVDGLPWHRIVGKGSGNRARIAIRDPIGAAMQVAMLRAEGITVSETETIALLQFGWRPRVKVARQIAASVHAIQSVD